MGRIYAWFLSLFPLLFGVGLILAAMQQEAEIAMTPEVTVPRDLLFAVGGVFILIAVLMMLMSRRVERALYGFTNLLLPKALRIRLSDATAAPAQPDTATRSGGGQILKQGRDYTLSRNYVLTSHIFPRRLGLSVGGLLLLPIVAHWVAFFLDRDLPSHELLDVLMFFMFIFGLGILGKRNVMRVWQKEGLLEDRGRVWWHEQSRTEPLAGFGRVIIKRWQMPGVGGGPRARYTRHPVLGVLYLVQLAGSGVRTINFYRRHSEARELAYTLAEVLRLPLREV